MPSPKSANRFSQMPKNEIHHGDTEFTEIFTEKKHDAGLPKAGFGFFGGFSVFFLRALRVSVVNLFVSTL